MQIIFYICQEPYENYINTIICPDHMRKHFWGHISSSIYSERKPWYMYSDNLEQYLKLQLNVISYTEHTVTE